MVYFWCHVVRVSSMEIESSSPLPKNPLCRFVGIGSEVWLVSDDPIEGLLVLMVIKLIAVEMIGSSSAVTSK